MRTLSFLLLSLLVSSIACQAGDAYISSWFKAKELLRTDGYEKSTEQFRACYDGAIAASDANYAWPAAERTAYGYYELGKSDEAGRFAEKALLDLSKLPQPDATQRTIVRMFLLSMVERRHQFQGRIGEAWRTVRIASDALRGKDPTTVTDASVITLEEVDKLPPAFEQFGYRLIERHAEYLDLTGHSDEALKVLATANDYAVSRWDEMTPNSKAYASKLRASHASLLDFLGYKAEAIKLLETLQQDAAGIPLLKSSRSHQKLNLLRHISQWEGPSEEILKEVRETAEAYNKESPQFAGRINQFVARMEMDFLKSEEAMNKLMESFEDARQRGDLFDALYFNQNQISARIQLGEEIDDLVFISQLEEARRQGNKRTEPTLYEAFADHLMQQNRIPEAMLLYREALRLVRSFGRPMHQFGILCAILDASVQSGDKQSITKAYDELVETLNSAKDRPDYMLAQIAISRASALIALGRNDEARAILEEAREQTKHIPDWMTRCLRPETAERLFTATPVIDGTEEEPEAKPVDIQPIEILSMAVPGTIAETRLTIENPGKSWISGHLVATGPGATFKEGTLELNTSQPTATAKLSMELSAGHRQFVPCYAVGEGDDTHLKADFRWSDPEAKTTTWEARWGATAGNKIVLDSSLLGTNPFGSVLLYHHLNFPENMTGTAIRLIAPQPLRIEYYDADSLQLLGVDANGNGDFTEVGDFISPSGGDTEAIWITKGKSRLLEARIFGAGKKGITLNDGPITLRMEAMVDGEWTLEAESVLQTR